jgi:hypothetical protein
MELSAGHIGAVQLAQCKDSLGAFVTTVETLVDLGADMGGRYGIEFAPIGFDERHGSAQNPCGSRSSWREVRTRSAAVLVFSRHDHIDSAGLALALWEGETELIATLPSPGGRFKRASLWVSGG